MGFVFIGFAFLVVVALMAFGSLVFVMFVIMDQFIGLAAPATRGNAQRRSRHQRQQIFYVHLLA